jgi:isochorismate pyruvate lyase
MDQTKLPEECTSLAEVRHEIDRIDRSIVAALGERRGYVMAALKFKSSPGAIAAPERVAAMLETRRKWALEERIDPNVIEAIYRALVDYFIAEETAHWKRSSQPLS